MFSICCWGLGSDIDSVLHNHNLWTQCLTLFAKCNFDIDFVTGGIRTRLARSTNRLSRATSLVFCWLRNMSAKPCLPAIRIIDPTARLKIPLPLWSDSRYVNR
jgi:hypothetical protein